MKKGRELVNRHNFFVQVTIANAFYETPQKRTARDQLIFKSEANISAKVINNFDKANEIVTVRSNVC